MITQSAGQTIVKFSQSRIGPCRGLATCEPTMRNALTSLASWRCRDARTGGAGTGTVCGWAVQLATRARGRQAGSGQSAGIGAGNASGPAARSALVDQYCVTCHNDRLKTGGLGAREDRRRRCRTANAEVLEKVVRKLRSGQMPPEGRPRPDKPTVDAFAASLETALDRAAASAPNPGPRRVAPLEPRRVRQRHPRSAGARHRRHRAAASDMAGFGFDNNADVLSITPALMARYIVGGHQDQPPRGRRVPTIARPCRSTRSEFGTRQDARMSEDMPFATHGGLAVRHTFPLDGEYAFAIRLRTQRHGQHHRRHRRGRAPDRAARRSRAGQAVHDRRQVQGPGSGRADRACPKTTSRARKVHDYRVNADKELEVRLPIKAGTRLVSVGVHRLAAVAGSDGSVRARGRIVDGGAAGHRHALHLRAVQRQDAATTRRAARRSSSAGRPSARDEEPCARQILTTLARRAYRRPVTDARRRAAARASTAKAARERDFDTGIERALEALLSSPKFLIRVEREPADAKPGTRLPAERSRAGLAAVVLPVEEHSGRRAARRRGARHAEGSARCSAQQVGACWPTARATRFMNDFVGAVAEGPQHPARTTPTRSCSPSSTTRCARRWRRRPSCSSRARSARTGRFPSCCAPTTPSSTSGWRGTTASTTSTAATSAA